MDAWKFGEMWRTLKKTMATNRGSTVEGSQHIRTSHGMLLQVLQYTMGGCFSFLELDMVVLHQYHNIKPLWPGYHNTTILYLENCHQGHRESIKVLGGPSWREVPPTVDHCHNDSQPYPWLDIIRVIISHLIVSMGMYRYKIIFNFHYPTFTVSWS